MEYLEEHWRRVCASIAAVAAVSGAAATYYLLNIPEPTCIPPVDLDDQSYILEDGSRCSKLVPKGKLLDHCTDGVNTMYDVFQRGIKKSGNGPCLGTRSGPNGEYVWISYQEVQDISVAFGSWMVDQGYKSKAETMIGIYSQNRPEWVFTEKACCAYSLVPVALYDTLGEEGVKFIIKQTNMSLIVCDVSDKANKSLQMLATGEVEAVKDIVVMNGTEAVNLDLAKKVGVKVTAFKDAVEKGKMSVKPVVPPAPDDLALICYTSGTTGNPKGVMIKQKQAMAQMAGLHLHFSGYRSFNKDDVHMSYLPLAHMYERIVQQKMFLAGARIGFFRGDVKLLLDDIQALKPTVLATVPRLLNRIYDKILSDFRGSMIQSALLRWAVSAKKKELKKFIIRKDSIWDKLVFKKVQNLFGGRVDIIFTGSAPLETEVLTFYRCALGCVFFEAYGQTEAVAGVSFTVPGDYNTGMVGPPLACNYLKLFDAPEFGYYAKDNQGEVCVWGPTVTSGYYKDQVKTAETFDKKGWLHTGDIGTWLPNGTLKIFDRMKNIFKLSQGEYVAPEKLEQVYVRSPFVAQAFVEGDSLKSYVVAVIVPDQEVLMGWAREHGVDGTFKDLCQRKSVKDLILSDIRKTAIDIGLVGFELPRNILLCPELFSVENNLLTPTFKNKRPQLRRVFKKDITKLYQESD